jgi:hypothetical protein
MLNSRRNSLALGACCLLLLVFASAALAAGPATVTVRVEGLTGTLLPPTQVTTTTEPVVKDGIPGDSCPGTSALGALQLASGGNWSGPWEASFKQYEIFSIEGENHPFGGGSFWDLWVNHMSSEVGACEAEPEAGQEVLLFPCPETATTCPSPLAMEALASAEVGEVAVTVKKYGAKGEASPVAGATVTGAAGGAVTDSSGQVTLSFPSPGEYTLHATAPESVRAETTICVHSGSDGTCGTKGPPSVTSSSAPPSPPYTGPYAVVAKAIGVIDNHVYSRKDAPKVLAGTALAHTTVASVSLELRRSYKGRCYDFDGLSTRFVKAYCGQGSFFKVSTTPSFSYLLPSALAPGRYVLDIEATDAAGNHTTLARGSSRVVFYVR